MRRHLIWALGASAALSAVVLWSDRSAQLVDAVRPAITAPPLRASNANGGVAEVIRHPLPSTLARMPLESATRDFFQPVPPPPASPPPVATLVVQAPMQAPSLPPPAMTYRYFGRMTLPDGTQMTYLADGDKAVPIAIGDMLESGYQVDRIEEDGVNLVHAPSGQSALIPIPISSGS